MRGFQFKYRSKQYMKLASIAIVLMLSFNNCEQTGKIALKKVSSNDIQSQPPVDQPPQYIDLTKTVDVSATASDTVDILIVIDNSGSMKYEQSNMAMRFASFIDQLQGLNWQLGIVTTDVSSDANLKDGRLIAFPDDANQFVLTSAMNILDVKDRFAKMIQRSETGSSDEQGIKATYRAIERSLNPNIVDVNAPNRQLFRAEAALAVLVVTDANETAKNLETRNDPNALYSYVRSSFGESKKFLFNSIVVKSGDDACRTNQTNSNEGFGVSYEALSMRTGGVIGSVCATDYASQLTNIGQGVIQLVTSLQLDCSPVDSDKNGYPDISITRSYLDAMGASQSEVIAIFDLKGSQVQSNVSTGFLPGKYSISYRCLKQ